MRIKNWKKFQHFSNRKPPWIKLYREILDDLEWHELAPEAAKTLVELWLIASEGENGELPSIRELSFRLRISEKDINRSLSKLSHWIEQDDIQPISHRYRGDPLETERETEEEREKETDCALDENSKPTEKKMTPIQQVVRGWKIQMGNEPDDSSWDKVHFAANASHAKKLLDLFDNDVGAVLDCIEDRWNQMVIKQGLSLSLAGVVKNSDVFRQRWLESKERAGVA